MVTVMPHSELVRKAVEYIGVRIKEKKQKGTYTKSDLYALIEEACVQFDLSPRDSALLHDFLERDSSEEAEESLHS